LVANASAANIARPPWHNLPIEPLDRQTRQFLSAQGLRSTSVPDVGRLVQLTGSFGDLDHRFQEDITQIVHPANRRLVEQVGELCGLNVGTVDVLSVDISQAWHSNGASVCDVNHAPLSGPDRPLNWHARDFIAHMITGDGRIPVEVYVGGAAAAMAACRRAGEFRQRGLETAITSHGWTQTTDGQHVPMAADGLYARTRALVLQPNLQALVLVVQTDEFIDTGLPIEGVDAVHWVDAEISSRRPEQVAERRRLLERWLETWVWPRTRQADH